MAMHTHSSVQFSSEYCYYYCSCASLGLHVLKLNFAQMT